jgi:hypothetical protein
MGRKHSYAFHGCIRLDSFVVDVCDIGVESFATRAQTRKKATRMGRLGRPAAKPLSLGAAAEDSDAPVVIDCNSNGIESACPPSGI